MRKLKIDAPVNHSYEHCAFCHSGYGAIVDRPDCQSGGSVSETGQLSDPNLEARAVALGRTLRCVVCANQSIEDSEVEMAQTLRRFVRERLGSGESENNIRAELIRSYGQFVSYEPAKSGFGLLLWGSPWLVLMIAGGAIFLAQQRRRPHV